MSTAEIEEIDMLVADATFSGVKDCLNAYKAKLLASAAPKPPSKVAIPVAKPSVSGGAAIIPAASSAGQYIQITDFAWDQGDYSSTTVTIYVELPGVGAVKDNVKCDFTPSSFDLIVCGLNGKNYRLLKDNLDKDISPSTSKIVVKRDKVVVKLSKAKQEHWSNLTSKKSKDKREAEQKDPSAGLMDMMKDMYNDGDENMKRIIGEAMLKSQRGEKSDPSSAMDGL